MLELAQWAASAREIPADVRERVRLQQLAAMGGSRHPSAAPVDNLFWASLGHGTPALWQAATGTVGELFRAAAVANEVCGRVALSHLLCPVDLDLGGLFAQVGQAVLHGEQPDLRHVQLGPIDVSGSLGRVWLTRCLGIALSPVHLQQRVAVEAVAEVLRRHRVAADKPLRPDQWARCTLRVPTWTLAAEAASDGSLERSIARSVGVLAVEQSLVPQAWEPSWWMGAKGEAASAVSDCVELVQDTSFSLEVIDHVGRSGLCNHADLLAVALDLPDPASLRSWVEVLRVSPLRLLHARAQALAEFDPTAFRTVLPVEVELQTIRGGVWTERRHLPEGSPGWFPEDTEARVLALRAAGDEAIAARPSDLPDNAPAEEWVALL